MTTSGVQSPPASAYNSVKNGVGWKPGPSYARWNRFLVDGGFLEGKIWSNFDGAKAKIFECPAKGFITAYARKQYNSLSDYSPNVYISVSLASWGVGDLYEGTNWFSIRKMKTPSKLYFLGENHCFYDTTGWLAPNWLPGSTALGAGLYGLDNPASSYQYDAHGNRTNMMFGDLSIKSLLGMEPHLSHEGGKLPWYNK